MLSECYSTSLPFFPTLYCVLFSVCGFISINIQEEMLLLAFQTRRPRQLGLTSDEHEHAKRLPYSETFKTNDFGIVFAA